MSATRLAIHGGPPAFSRTLHVGRPNIGDRGRLLERLKDILDRKWFTNDGPYVREFESSIAKITGTRNCIALCNGTIALEVLIKALELSGEVIVPSFTFIATPHALEWQRITPVFCDINPATHTIDPNRIEELITPRTSGIIGVHIWGRGCEVDALEEIAGRHNLKLIFDAAHAFNCSQNGTMIGNFGEAEVFSFHATKFVNSFEGGAVVTNDDELVEKLRLMRNYGFAGDAEVVHLGTNGKMCEVSAAMGLTSLEDMDEVMAVNRRNYETYRDALRGLPGISLYAYDKTEPHNYQYVVLEIDSSESGIMRDTLLKVLRAENVLARRYFYPGCHRMEPYRSAYPQADLRLPATNTLVERVLLLPTGTDVEVDDINVIASVIRTCLEHAADLAAQFSDSPSVIPASEEFRRDDSRTICW